MKQLLITIAAVVLMGCGPSVDIHKAAKEGNIEAVKQHIAAGTDVNAKDRKEGWTPLYWAVRAGQKEIAELLIEVGAYLNAKSGTLECTPLYRAIFLHSSRKGSSREFTELLIAKGADVNLSNKDGTTPLRRVSGDKRKLLNC